MTGVFVWLSMLSVIGRTSSMRALGRNIYRLSTESVRIEEFGNNQNWWRTPTQKFQARHLALGLGIITYGNADYIRRLIRSGINTSACSSVGRNADDVDRACRRDFLDDVGEQRLERLGALSISLPCQLRIAGAELRAGLPQVAGLDQKYDPVLKQPLLARVRF